MEVPEIKGYCVYYHRNLENGKLYIGLSKDIKTRWLANGKQYKDCIHFYRAIQKYGWNNFEHVVLIDGLTKQEASIIEQELIAKYDTRKNGYNITKGGDGGCNTKKGKDLSFSKPVYQYDLDGNYIREWENSLRASEELNISSSSIRRTCNGKQQKAGNFMWSFIKYPKLDKYVYIRSYEPILQIDKNFNIVEIYKCVSYIDSSIYDRRKVTSCCKKKHVMHKEYYWVYEKDFDESFIEYIKNNTRELYTDDKLDLKTTYKGRTPKRILQCDLISHNIIKEYSCPKEVEKETGINRSTVQGYCAREGRNHGVHTGYYWVYAEDYYKESNKTN